MDAVSLVHCDLRITGFPGCRVRHYTRFLHVVFSRRNYWENWNRLALLPTKYKTESQSRLWNVNFIVELPMASWGSNQNSLLGLLGGVRGDAVPQALLWEGGGLSGLTIVDFILSYILGCTQIIISTNLSSLSSINLFQKKLVFETKQRKHLLLT